MSREKGTPPDAADWAREGVDARPCGPHVHEDTHAGQADNLGYRPETARSPRGESLYRPGSDYLPPKETLARCQSKVLDLLRARGARGVTRREAPLSLALRPIIVLPTQCTQNCAACLPQCSQSCAASHARTGVASFAQDRQTRCLRAPSSASRSTILPF